MRSASRADARRSTGETARRSTGPSKRNRSWGKTNGPRKRMAIALTTMQPGPRLGRRRPRPFSSVIFVARRGSVSSSPIASTPQRDFRIKVCSAPLARRSPIFVPAIRRRAHSQAARKLAFAPSSRFSPACCALFVLKMRHDRAGRFPRWTSSAAWEPGHLLVMALRACPCAGAIGVPLPAASITQDVLQGLHAPRSCSSTLAIAACRCSACTMARDVSLQSRRDVDGRVWACITTSPIDGISLWLDDAHGLHRPDRVVRRRSARSRCASKIGASRSSFSKAR